MSVVSAEARSAAFAAMASRSPWSLSCGPDNAGGMLAAIMAIIATVAVSWRISFLPDGFPSLPHTHNSFGGVAVPDAPG